MNKKKIAGNMCFFVAGLAAALFIYGCAYIPGARPESARVPYSQWPQVRFRDVRVLIADEPELAFQGFAGVSPREMQNTLIIFPGIGEGTVFTNADQGFGKVESDIKIVFLDADMRILKTDVMKRGIGHSTAPADTFIVIEGLVPID